MDIYDPTSYCDGNSIITKHLNIFWKVDFRKHTLDGNVEIKLQALKNGVKQIVSTGISIVL